MGALLLLVAVVDFVLIAFGVTAVTPSVEREIAGGLALVAAALLVGHGTALVARLPGSDGSGGS